MRDREREERFVERLLRIYAACRQEPTDLALEVYAEALCYQSEPDEWDRFTRESVATGRWRFVPTVAELLDALREWRGASPLDAEAAEAYAAVVACGVVLYHPESGEHWTFRVVAEACGKAAAEAFLAAGGDDAFRTSWDEPKRRERFREAYMRAGREEPQLRLSAHREGQKRLADGSGALGVVESTGLLEQIASLVPERVLVWPTKALEDPYSPHLAPLSESAWDRRQAELQEQARTLREEES